MDAIVNSGEKKTGLYCLNSKYVPVCNKQYYYSFTLGSAVSPLIMNISAHVDIQGFR